MNVNIYHKHKDIIITIFIIASRAYLQQKAERRPPEGRWPPTCLEKRRSSSLLTKLSDPHDLESFSHLRSSSRGRRPASPTAAQICRRQALSNRLIDKDPCP